MRSKLAAQISLSHYAAVRCSFVLLLLDLLLPGRVQSREWLAAEIQRTVYNVRTNKGKHTTECVTSIKDSAVKELAGYWNTSQLTSEENVEKWAAKLEPNRRRKGGDDLRKKKRCATKMRKRQQDNETKEHEEGTGDDSDEDGGVRMSDVAEGKDEVEDHEMQASSSLHFGLTLRQRVPQEEQIQQLRQFELPFR
ncbi:hypothetical protein LTR64_000666 [Lithohypha guttulata]|uniref:uncharacterized protein n=1 Tax=Lithohypha guttulata TaxID=1690604 RepID=UPI002DE18EF8|nr:hypothetical protein LTR51_005565 [Lithohypha guttulata]